MATLLALLAAPGPRAQTSPGFPVKPIAIVVPSSSGGSVEAQARILGEAFRERHGVAWTFEMRPGAMGSIGATAVARAAPDGYTLLASPNSPIVFNPLTNKSLSYDPSKFTPVQLVASQPLVMATRGDFPGETMKDLVDHARNHPGGVYYGSQGIGGGNHMSALLLEKHSGVAMKHVPFPGAGPATQALLRGEVDFFMAPMAEILPWYRDGKLKIFAVGSRERHPDAPDAPTFREQGYPEDFVLTVWSALLAPPDTPASVADWLNEATTGLLRLPVVRDRFRTLGVDPGGVPRRELALFLDRERATWERVARANNIEKQ